MISFFNYLKFWILPKLLNSNLPFPIPSMNRLEKTEPVIFLGFLISIFELSYYKAKMKVDISRDYYKTWTISMWKRCFLNMMYFSIIASHMLRIGKANERKQKCLHYIQYHNCLNFVWQDIDENKEFPTDSFCTIVVMFG